MKWWVYVNDDVMDNPLTKNELNQLDEFGPDVPVMNVNREEWIPAKKDPVLRKQFDDLPTLNYEAETGTSKEASDGTGDGSDETEWLLQSGEPNPDGPYTLNELVYDMDLDPAAKIKRTDSNRWVKAVKDPLLRFHLTIEPTYEQDGINDWIKSFPRILRDVVLSPGQFFDGIHPTSPLLFSWFFGIVVLGIVSLLLSLNRSLLGVSAFGELVESIGYYIVFSPVFILSTAIPASVGLLIHSAIFDLYANFFVLLFGWKKNSFQATTKIVSYTHGATAVVFCLVATLLIVILNLAQFLVPSIGEFFLVSGSTGFSIMVYALLLIGVFWTLRLTYVGFLKMHELSEGQALTVVMVPPIISLGFGLILYRYVLSAFLT